MKRLLLAAVVLLLLAGSALATTYTVAWGAGGRTKYTLINAGTAAATGHVLETMGSMESCTCYVVWGTTTTKGAVIIETSYLDSYTGTWAPLATVNWTANTKTDVVQVLAPTWAIRPRISVDSDGTGVSVYCTAR
jgi:hypothetical protein